MTSTTLFTVRQALPRNPTGHALELGLQNVSLETLGHGNKNYGGLRILFCVRIQ